MFGLEIAQTVSCGLYLLSQQLDAVRFLFCFGIELKSILGSVVVVIVIWVRDKFLKNSLETCCAGWLKHDRRRTSRGIEVEWTNIKSNSNSMFMRCTASVDVAQSVAVQHRLSYFRVYYLIIINSRQGNLFKTM